ncbi:MAG: 4-hydroxybenzoate polyprenyltransferase [Proteobacteria bacterium]|nr:MAG: 4-hydroxybenzoate polyprenyltransferase [Pseudomonadota bacterium]
MNTFLEKLKDIGELIVAKHSIFSLPFIFVAMIVGSYIQSGSAWFGWKLLILGLLCTISARNFAMGLNRYLDKDIDALNPRTASRPSVDGRIGAKNLLIFIGINAFIFVLVAYFINDLAFLLSLPILFILGIYSYIKRISPLAHLVLGMSLGLAPIAGAIAVTNDIPLWAFILSIGVMFWVAGFDLLYSLQDIEFDKNHKLHSIPSHFGQKCTFFVSQIFHALSILFWSLFVGLAGLGCWAWMGIFVSGIILWKEHEIVNKDFSKIDRAFFTLNGYLGIIFFILIWLDL